MSGRLYLLMDWHNGGHLLRLLHEKSPFTENETRFYLSELVAAIEGLFCWFIFLLFALPNIAFQIQTRFNLRQLVAANEGL